MSQPNTSIFAGLREAQITKRGAYFEPGEYRVKITKCQVIRPRSGGYAYVVDFLVVEGQNTGSERNWYVDMTKDSAKGNLKGFILAALGIDYSNPQHKDEAEKQIVPRIEEIAEASVGTSQFLVDKELLLKAVKTTTRNNTEFTRHDWRPVSA